HQRRGGSVVPLISRAPVALFSLEPRRIEIPDSASRFALLSPFPFLLPLLVPFCASTNHTYRTKMVIRRNLRRREQHNPGQNGFKPYPQVISGRSLTSEHGRCRRDIGRD